MAYSFNVGLASGTSNVILVTFPFLEREHVHFKVDNVEVPLSDFTWINDGEIHLDTIPAANTLLEARRLTPADEPAVIFQAGNLSSNNLNIALLQQLYIAQEAFDSASALVEGIIGQYVERAETAAADAAASLAALQGQIDAITLEVTNIIEEATGSGPIAIVAADLAGAGFSYDLGVLGDPVENVPGYSPDGYIRRVAENMDAILAVQSNAANINSLVTKIIEIAALGPVADDIGALGPYAADLHTLALNLGAIEDLAPVASDIAALGPVAADIDALGPYAADIHTVAIGGGVPPNSSVTNTKMADMAALTVKVNATNADAAPQDLAASTAGQVLMRTGTTLVFDLVKTANLADSNVTHAKYQNIATNTVLGRVAGGSGVLKELSASELNNLLGFGSTAGQIHVGSVWGGNLIGFAGSGQVAGFDCNDSGGTGAGVNVNRPASDGWFVAFARGGTGVGSIAVSSSVTAYNTTSDYRLKANEAEIGGEYAKAQVLQLRPLTYEFKTSPGVIHQGFFAHEVQEIVPGAVTDAKDARGPDPLATPEKDEEGNDLPLPTVDVFQQLDASKLIPLLVAGLKQAFKEIDDLKAQLNGA